MAVKVLIVGDSGAGKSASLRNFEENEIAIFNVSEKPLPFRKKLPVCKTNNMKFIKEEIERNVRNCYVVDDAGLAMTFYLFGKVNEKGYDKFTQVAKDFYEMVQAVDKCSDDTIVYFTMHCERSDDGAKIKAKTAGKMIDTQLTLESLFTIVLYCVTDGKSHKFITQSDGVITAKSPMEMFPYEMDNDLKAVDTAIREYYGLDKLGTAVKKKGKNSKGNVEVTDRIPG